MNDRTSASGRETATASDTNGNLQWALRIASRVKDGCSAAILRMWRAFWQAIRS